MIRAELEGKVLSLISQLSTLKAHELRREQRLREDLGMDSVSSMELLSMVAEELDLDISVEDAAGITTVGGTLELVAQHYERSA
ncbi:MAG: hypothetical protein IT381_15370 [Deltaproteobacteria bacterium]|nr:hypothetical protein [Deltaproteobacteria bacterium]